MTHSKKLGQNMSEWEISWREGQTYTCIWINSKIKRVRSKFCNSLVLWAMDQLLNITDITRINLYVQGKYHVLKQDYYFWIFLVTPHFTWTFWQKMWFCFRIWIKIHFLKNNKLDQDTKKLNCMCINFNKKNIIKPSPIYLK